MANIGICIVVILSLFQGFTFAYQLSGFRKTILNIPISLFETSIPLLQEDNNEFIGYFDKKVLETQLVSYFDQNLKQFVNDFTVSYFYYSTADNLYCKGDYCDGIKIKVKGKISLIFEVEQKMFYEIKQNKNESTKSN